VSEVRDDLPDEYLGENVNHLVGRLASMLAFTRCHLRALHQTLLDGGYSDVAFLRNLERSISRDAMPFFERAILSNEGFRARHSDWLREERAREERYGTWFDVVPDPVRRQAEGDDPQPHATDPQTSGEP
jgi:hypothetical protein